MRHTPERHTDAADRTVKDIRRKNRKHYSSEDKIRIVLAGLRGEDTIAKLCRQKGIGTASRRHSADELERQSDAAGCAAFKRIAAAVLEMERPKGRV